MWDTESSDSDEEWDRLLSPTGRIPRSFRERVLLDFNSSDKEFREQFRVPKEVAHHLISLLSDALRHKSKRNMALSPQQQVLLFLHMTGTDSFYHVMRSAHGVSSPTVCRVIHRVASEIVRHQSSYVLWPRDCISVAQKFRRIAGMPATIGVLDGTHIRINAPAHDEAAYVNRHHYHSMNVALCCGPNYEFYFVNASCPGSWHDARVLRTTTLWDAFDRDGRLPFDGAVILCDSAYPVRSWLIPSFRGEVNGAKLSFNRSHKKTRCIVERAIGILKERFYALKRGLRFHNIERVCVVIKALVAVHNMCVQQGDTGDDYVINAIEEPAEELINQQGDQGTGARREQLVATFQ